MTPTDSAAQQYADKRVAELIATPTGHALHGRWLHSLEEREHLASLLAAAYHAGAGTSGRSPAVTKSE